MRSTRLRRGRNWDSLPLLLAALVLAAACGDAGALGAGAQEEVDAAREVAEQAQIDANGAVRRLAVLEDQLDELEAQLGAARDGRRKLATRIRSLGGALRKSLERLRAAVEGAQAGTASAEANADEALARAAQIARDLSVLEQRYNYHLRRYHGGG